jgi:hypothetical protein
MTADQYQRVIELAQRAMELDRELAAVKSELARAQAEATGDSSVREIMTAALRSSDDAQPSLSNQVLAVFKKTKSKPLAGEDVARALGVTDTKEVNTIRSYLVRFAQRKQLRQVRRGYYQWPE